jgi:hypothetical protein
MVNKLLRLTLLLTLTSCAEFDELNKSLTGATPSPAVTNSSTPAKVSAKRFVAGDCAYVEPRICVPDEYGLYYTDNTYSAVTKEAYEKAQLGDTK